MIEVTDLGLLTAKEFVARRSKTLAQNPAAELNEVDEVESYLSKLDASYRAEINELSQTSTKPLASTVKEIVTIIAYHEGSRIRRKLDTFVMQDFAPEHFEVILLDNHPSTTGDDNTRIEVERFMKENPGISVLYVHKVWQKPEHATVGNARKYVFDIALARLWKRGSSASDTILISNDADTVAIDGNYLSSIADEFDQKPVVDALVTSNGVPFDTIVKPNLYGVLSFWDALDEVVGEDEPFNLMGSSSAFRASMYAAVGGYNPKAKQTEDLEIGFMVADARNWNPDCVIQFKNTKHVQDPRRMLEAVASRVPINEMYFQFESNPEIRNADSETLLSYIPDDLDWDLLEEDLDSFRAGSKTGMYKWRGQRFEGDYDAAMKKIGVEYTIENDRLKLLNIDRLLQNYQNEFGNKPAVIHSHQRVLDIPKMIAMGNFFSSVSDSAIACREKMAKTIEAQIIKRKLARTDPDFEKLVAQYRRFAGHDYLPAAVGSISPE